MKRPAAFVLAILFASSGAAGAQRSGPAYPNVDKPFAFASGDTVQLLSRLVQDASPMSVPPGKRLDFVYSTSVPASNRPARIAQADRAAQAFGVQATELGVRRLSIGICDTRECAQRKHPPSEWYLYERAASGWKRVQ